MILILIYQIKKITFSNKSNVTFYISDKEKHAEIKNQEKEKIL